VSVYVTVDLEINDGDCLRVALEEMGYKVEVHEEAQPLIGFQGDKRKQKANVIVRRKHVGSASNDVGFLKQDDGTYQMIISEYDMRGKRQQEDFTKRLNQIYAKHKVVKQAKKLGMTITSQKTTNDNKIKIKVLVP